MKQLIVDYPDHLPRTALIEFIIQACHRYHDQLQENLEEGNPELNYLEDLMESVNNMGFNRYAEEMTQVWQLRQQLRDSNYET